VLAGAFVYFWNDSPTVTATQGIELGDLCFGAELQTVTAEGLTGNTLDPTKTGKLTIINFWGTWCSGCVAELPYFDRIATEYSDDVVVVAVHTAMLLDTAPAYIAQNYPASNIVFASDFANPDNPLADQYYTQLGGRDSYPYTVVIDENGVIVAKFVASVTYEDLYDVVNSHLGA
jgi:thiol-disulfide isomerase/thioredoxin